MKSSRKKPANPQKTIFLFLGVLNSPIKSAHFSINKLGKNEL